MSKKFPKCNETAIQVTGKCRYHGDPIVVCKLVAEERAKSDVLDTMLSGGLCGILSASKCGSARDFPLVPLASCVVVSTLSVSTLDDEGPRRGLIKAVCGGAKRFTTAPSEGNEEHWVDAWMPSTIPGRCREAEPVACISAACGNSGLKKNDPSVSVDVVSAASNEGTGGG